MYILFRIQGIEVYWGKSLFRTPNFIFKMTIMVLCILYKNVHCAIFYILILLLIENEDLSQEDGPEVKEPLPLAADPPSPETRGWGVENNSVESSSVDSSVVSGTCDTYILYRHQWLLPQSQFVHWWHQDLLSRGRKLGLWGFVSIFTKIIFLEEIKLK